MDNPDWADPPFDSKQVIKVRELKVEINMRKMLTSLGKEFEITNILLDGVQVTVEKAGISSTSNVGMIMDFMKPKAHHDENGADRAKKLIPTCWPKKSASEPSSSLVTSEKTCKVVDEEETKENDKNEDEDDDIKAKKKKLKIEVRKILVKDIQAEIIQTGVGTLLSVALAPIDYPDLEDRLSEGAMAADIVLLVVSTLLKTVVKNGEVIKKLAMFAGKATVRKLTKCCTPQEGKKQTQARELPDYEASLAAEPAESAAPAAGAAGVPCQAEVATELKLQQRIEKANTSLGGAQVGAAGHIREQTSQ